MYGVRLGQLCVQLGAACGVPWNNVWFSFVLVSEKFILRSFAPNWCACWVAFLGSAICSAWVLPWSCSFSSLTDSHSARGLDFNRNGWNNRSSSLDLGSFVASFVVRRWDNFVPVGSFVALPCGAAWAAFVYSFVVRLWAALCAATGRLCAAPSRRCGTLWCGLGDFVQLGAALSSFVQLLCSSGTTLRCGLGSFVYSYVVRPWAALWYYFVERSCSGMALCSSSSSGRSLQQPTRGGASSLCCSSLAWALRFHYIRSPIVVRAGSASSGGAICSAWARPWS